MAEEKNYPTWKERGYKDTRNRNKRRFFMLEQTEESRALVMKARTRLAAARGVANTKQALPDAEVIREALRHFSGGKQSESPKEKFIRKTEETFNSD